MSDSRLFYNNLKYAVLPESVPRCMHCSGKLAPKLWTPDKGVQDDE